MELYTVNITNKLFRVALLVLLLSPTSAWAAFVTTNESEMDAVFSQDSFGLNKIDIVFNSTITIQNSSLLNIDSEDKINQLFHGLNTGVTWPTVNLFFVDTISYCSGYNTSIIGCASFPGNDIVVESAYAAGSKGAELLAHELGHNLGLGHNVPELNLMHGTINENTDLTAAQVVTILGSGLVQNIPSDGDLYRIEITPILIAAVPLPGALVLLLSGLSFFGIASRRAQQRA